MGKRFLTWKKNVPAPYRKWKDGVLVCCDANEFLSGMRDEIADIVFLDPPFNLGKKYGNRGAKADLMDEQDYISFIQEILLGSVRVLKKGGALYLYHIPQWAVRLGSFLDKKMSFRHWIAVSMKNGFARGDFLYPAHYALLYFTKGKPTSFHRPKLPPPKCRKCNEYIRDYGGYKQFVKEGINLTDIWEDLSPVRHRNKKNRLENELPLELVRRVIQISGKRGGVFVDPFVGSGTSIVAVAESGMRFLACDRESNCCDIAAGRLSSFKAGK